MKGARRPPCSAVEVLLRVRGRDGRLVLHEEAREPPVNRQVRVVVGDVQLAPHNRLVEVLPADHDPGNSPGRLASHAAPDTLRLSLPTFQGNLHPFLLRKPRVSDDESNDAPDPSSSGVAHRGSRWEPRSLPNSPRLHVGELDPGIGGHLQRQPLRFGKVVTHLCALLSAG